MGRGGSGVCFCHVGPLMPPHEVARALRARTGSVGCSIQDIRKVISVASRATMRFAVPALVSGGRRQEPVRDCVEGVEKLRPGAQASHFRRCHKHGFPIVLGRTSVPILILQWHLFPRGVHMTNFNKLVGVVEACGILPAGYDSSRADVRFCSAYLVKDVRA